jgi:uncharacterized protein (DUF58 family)
VTQRSYRLQPTGAALLVVVLFLALRPPPALDPELTAVVWGTLLGILVVGAAWPPLALRLVKVAAQAPADGVVGAHVPVRLVLGGRGRGLAVRLRDPVEAWHRTAAPGEGRVGHQCVRRGVFGGLVVDLRSSSPFGVAVAHRRVHLTLDHPITVAPKPLKVDWRPQPAPFVDATDARTTARLDGDVVRSVRPYALGDPAHLVHWPSSARLGELVVRELEPPTPRGQAIVVDLRVAAGQVESVASYAAGAVAAVLGAGGQVVLSTCEPDGPVTAPVHTPLAAGRRLARAVAGPPGEPPAGWSVVELGGAAPAPLRAAPPRGWVAAPGSGGRPR